MYDPLGLYTTPKYDPLGIRSQPPKDESNWFTRFLTKGDHTPAETISPEAAKGVTEGLKSAASGMFSWIPAGQQMVADVVGQGIVNNPLLMSNGGLDANPLVMVDKPLPKPTDWMGAAQRSRETQEALTYEPKTEEGKQAAEVFAKPFTALAEAGNESRDYWYNKAEEEQSKGNTKTAEFYRTLGLTSGIGGEGLPFLAPVGFKIGKNALNQRSLNRANQPYKTHESASKAMEKKGLTDHAVVPYQDGFAIIENSRLAKTQEIAPPDVPQNIETPAYLRDVPQLPEGKGTIYADYAPQVPEPTPIEKFFSTRGSIEPVEPVRPPLPSEVIKLGPPERPLYERPEPYSPEIARMFQGAKKPQLPAPESLPPEPKQIPYGQPDWVIKPPEPKSIRRPWLFGAEEATGVNVEYKPTVGKTGKPFKTEANAEKAAINAGIKANEFEVVKVGDGFGYKKVGRKIEKGETEVNQVTLDKPIDQMTLLEKQEAVSRIVEKEAGSSDPQTIADYYRNKYGTSRIRVILDDSAKITDASTSSATLNGEKVWNVHIPGKLKTRIAEILRHEIEHIVDWDVRGSRDSVAINETRESTFSKRNHKTFTEDYLKHKTEQEGSGKKPIENLFKKEEPPTDAGNSEAIELNSNGKKITVYKNPTPLQMQTLSMEFKEKYPNALPGEPKSRVSFDADGNTYRWSSDYTHDTVENLLKEKGIKANQNKDFSSPESKPVEQPKTAESTVTDVPKETPIQKLFKPEQPKDVFSRMPDEALKQQAELGVEGAKKELAKRQADRPSETKTAEVKPVIPKNYRTQNTTTSFNVAKVNDTFSIKTKDGAEVTGYLKNQDFPNEGFKPDRGEIFLTKVPSELEGKGLGLSLTEDAVKLMAANGTKTLNLHATSPGGERIVQKLIENKFISEPIKTSERGKTEHTIFPQETPIQKLFKKEEPKEGKQKVIEPTPKEEKTVTSPKEQKKYLVSAIDEAIKNASNEKSPYFGQKPSKYESNERLKEFADERREGLAEDRAKFGTVKIEIPNDGTFEIVNTKQALNEFKKQAIKFPVSVGEKKATALPSTRPTDKRITTEDVSYYNEFKPRKQKLIQGDLEPDGKTPRNFYVDGWFSDGRYAIKTEKPTFELNPNKPDIKRVIPKDADLEPAKIVGEAFEGSSNGVPKAHIKTKSGRDIILDARFADVILTKYPKANIFSSDKTVVFKDGKQTVGVAMPLAFDKSYLLQFSDRIAEITGEAPKIKLSDERGSFSWKYKDDVRDQIKANLNPQSVSSKVHDMYDRTVEKRTEREATTLKKVRDAFVKGVVDVSGNLKREALAKDPVLGKQVVMDRELLAGASTKASNIIDKARKEIFNDLRGDEAEVLNRVIQSRRIIDIDNYKTNIEHPEGLGGAEHRTYLNDLERINPELSRKLNERADKYFEVMRDQVNELERNGVISKEQADALRQHEYSPRQFFQYLDPENSYNFGGKKITVPDSGIKKLEEGSVELLENNAERLIAETVMRTQARIFRNNANKSLWEFANNVPDNGIARPAKITRYSKNGVPEYEVAPGGYEKVKVQLNGETKEMIMPWEMAQEWVKSDPLIDQSLANIISTMSGARFLKPVATGYNPAFVISNIPRDLGLIWAATQQYSPHLPVAGAQMIRDFATVAKDVITRKGRVQEFIDDGGGMNFLTYYGRWKGKGHVGETLNNVGQVMGWLGETSELWSRMALRERAIGNGLSPKEATWEARRYLDFSQGGNVIKALDVGIPYLNAAVQGTRGLFRGFKENPKIATYKMAQLATAATSIYLANYLTNPEALKAISDREKEANFIITTPISYEDDKGQTRYLYAKIAKDQGQRVVTSACESVMQKYFEGKSPTKQMLMAVNDLVNVWSLPPTLAAGFSYLLNKDTWTNDDIWKGPKVDPQEEYTNRTHPFWKSFGQVTGLSPDRSSRAASKVIPSNNPFVNLVGGSYRALTGSLSEELQKKSMTQILTENPSIKRLLSSTNPNTQDRDVIEEAKTKESTRRYSQNREMDNLSEKFLKSGNDTDRQKLLEYLEGAPEQDQQRLINRFKHTEQFFNLPNRQWWVSASELSPEVRARVFYDKFKKAPESEQAKMLEIADSVSGFTSDRFMQEMEILLGKE